MVRMSVLEGPGMAEWEHGPLERAATVGADARGPLTGTLTGPATGPELSVAERTALADLLAWARAIDGADSYAGFTLCAWARARPGSAVEALEDRLRRETNRIGVSDG